MFNPNRRFATCLLLIFCLLIPIRALAQTGVDERPDMSEETGPDALHKGDFVAIIGDSITEQKMYSVLIEDYLLMCQPAKELRAMQFGWGGETSWGFAARMANDCFRYHPIVATTCYGMNDGGYAPLAADRAKQYHDNQTGIVEGMKKANVRFIVVGSPGCVDSFTYRRSSPDHTGQAVMYNKTLSQLRDIAKQVAQEQHVAFADVYDPMYDVMAKAKAKYGEQYALCGGDGVHPGWNGHLVMAYAFLKGLGCNGDIGTITLNLATGQVLTTKGHKFLSYKNSVIELESSRYPFCFPGDPKSDDSPTKVLEFFPFNQDLNRFMLIVKDAKADGQYKVTWGSATRTFAGAALINGINLAAEFLDSPFTAAFQRVHQAVYQQQDLETPMIKSLVHSLPQYEQMVPGDTSCLEKVATDLGSKDVSLAAIASDAVQPVKHTIKIEAISP